MTDVTKLESQLEARSNDKSKLISAQGSSLLKLYNSGIGSLQVPVLIEH